MSGMLLESLSFASEPGTYEIASTNGRTYEVSLAPYSLDAGTLVISRLSDKPDEHEGREVLGLVDLFALVGQDLVFTIPDGKGGEKDVKAGECLSVKRVD